jgi:hypothetical protein
MWLRWSFYAIFSIFAAPFEAWSFYFNGLGASQPELTNYPWSHGLLYALAIILVAESIFRMVHHWEITKKSVFMQIVLFFAALLEVGMVFFYLMSERIRIINHQPLVDATGRVQNILVLVALVVAWTSFFVIERKERVAEPSS